VRWDQAITDCRTCNDKRRELVGSVLVPQHRELSPPSEDPVIEFHKVAVDSHR
jgi:hypothetical protein